MRFFRSIRRKLTTKKKFKKYLAYSMGEILLIVIGILIAIQINIWNNRSIEKRIAKEVKVDLKNEFEFNKTLFEETQVITIQLINTLESLLSLTGKDKQIVEAEEFDSLLYYSMFAPVYHPSYVVLNDILNSGNIKLLQNKKLRRRLYEWNSKYDNLKQSQNSTYRDLKEQEIPYLNSRISFKQIEKYGSIINASDSNAAIDNRVILNELEFENLIDNYLYSVKYDYNDFLNIGMTLDSILLELK